MSGERLLAHQGSIITLTAYQSPVSSADASFKSHERWRMDEAAIIIGNSHGRRLAALAKVGSPH